VLRLFATAQAELGRLVALVNNAGVLDRQSTVANLQSERIHGILAVNVLGAFLCAREAVRAMSTDSGGLGGAIVNVSSRAAVLGGAGEYVDYAASKAAVDALTGGWPGGRGRRDSRERGATGPDRDRDPRQRR
jgi:NAD(P)-dependent dehydrogenase (short-subunit alcohol dehydrogenase family)